MRDELLVVLDALREPLADFLAGHGQFQAFDHLFCSSPTMPSSCALVKTERSAKYCNARTQVLHQSALDSCYPRSARLQNGIGLRVADLAGEVVMAVGIQRNMGLLVLAIWLILYGLAGLVSLGLPAPLMAILALIAGVMILAGR